METILSIDESIFTFINSQLSHGFLDLILVPIRHKLFWLPLYLFLIAFVFVNYRNQAWVVFIGIILTVLISDTLSSKIIKKNVQRIRPCHIEKLDPVQRVPCSNGFSFTSSHATNHFAIGSFFFFLLSFLSNRWLFLGWAGIISFAQVYVGVHYPFDVLCGSLLGLVIGWFTFNIYRQLRDRIYQTEKILV